MVLAGFITGTFCIGPALDGWDSALAVKTMAKASESPSTSIMSDGDAAGSRVGEGVCGDRCIAQGTAASRQGLRCHHSLWTGLTLCILSTCSLLWLTLTVFDAQAAASRDSSSQMNAGNGTTKVALLHSSSPLVVQLYLSL